MLGQVPGGKGCFRSDASATSHLIQVQGAPLTVHESPQDFCRCQAEGVEGPASLVRHWEAGWL